MKRKTILLSVLLVTLSSASWADEVNDSIYKSYELEQVVVTGTRTPKLLANTPVLTKIITSDDIAKTDATNLRDLLQQVMPGVEFSYAMNQQVHMNVSGFGGQSVLILVDGERATCIQGFALFVGERKPTEFTRNSALLLSLFNGDYFCF